MAPPDLREAPLHRRQVQSAPEAHGEGDVVGGAPRIELLDDPQALLGKGERQRPVAGHRQDRRDLQTVAGSQGEVDLGRLGGDRPAGEQRPQRHVDAQGFADAGSHLGSEQGMPSEAEEIVRHADPVTAQHLGPDTGQQVLGQGARRDLVRRRFRGGLGKRPPIHFAVGGQGERREGNEGCRNHRLRQGSREEGAQLRGAGVGSRPRHDVGHQTPIPSLLAQHHRSRQESRVAEQRRLDLTQLDAEAPQLDLVVAAPQELELAGGQDARPIAGAIEPCAGITGEGVGDEPRGRQVGTPLVAARQAGASDAELAGEPGGSTGCSRDR